MNRQRHNPKSAYGADPIDPPSAPDREPGQCAAYGCCLRGVVASTTMADESTKCYCLYHDGQKTQDFDAISQHLAKRKPWLNVIALSQHLQPHEYDELVNAGADFNVPKGLQPVPGMNVMQWRQFVASKVRARISQEIAAIVDQQASSRGVDETKSSPDRLSWAAKILLGRMTHQEIDAA